MTSRITDKDELVASLAEVADDPTSYSGWADLCGSARDLIEAQAAENRVLRRKLAEFGVTLVDNVDAHLAALNAQSTPDIKGE